MLEKPPTPVLIEDIGMMYHTIKSKKKYRFGIYKCSCGKEFRAMQKAINSRGTASCGCYSRKVHSSHNKTGHIIFKVWSNMIKRCINPNDKSFNNYGGRGIIVCERWKNVSSFIDDMYPSYQEGLMIDRIDVNGNYEPYNCRWTTKEVQARNTRILRADNTSGYRGVSLVKINKKYKSAICINKKTILIGIFATSLEAAKAYDKYVIDNNLEHTINGVI